MFKGVPISFVINTFSAAIRGERSKSPPPPPPQKIYIFGMGGILGTMLYLDTIILTKNRLRSKWLF